MLRDKYDFVLAIKVTGKDSIEKFRYSLNGVFSHVLYNADNDIIIRN